MPNAFSPFTGRGGQIMPVTVSDWMKIKQLLSPNISDLIDICIEIERHLDHMKNNIGSDWIDGNDVARFEDCAQRLMDRYLEFISGIPDITDDIRKELVNDVNTTFSIFIDRSGNFKDLGTIFAKHVETGTMGMFFPTYIQPIVGFMHSRIYDSMVNYINEKHKEESGKLALIISRKRGLYRPPSKEEGVEIQGKAEEKEE